MLNLFSSQNKVCFYILILHTCKTSYSSFRFFFARTVVTKCTNKVSVKNGHQAKNKLAIKGCRKMSILKTASSPMMLDQVYLVPDETASKDTRLGYKNVLHVVQSQKLKAQMFEDICLVYLTTGVNAMLQMKYLEMYLDHSNCKYIWL